MDRYTRYPRPVLWLIPGGSLSASSLEVEPFYLSQQPVTNEQMQAFDPGFLRSPLAPGNQDPATGVSWEAATAYCRWYAQVSRKAIRLPSESEWEHACRGGREGRWFFDSPEEADLYLWDRRNSGESLPPLDAKRSNPHGLYGMLGGVWEWTATPEGEGGSLRVLRGGSFRQDREEISCSCRRLAAPGEPVEDAGFRIARSLR